MSAEMPRAVSGSTVQIAGHRLRVYQLDNGQRIINADDFVAFMAAFESGLILTQEQADELAAHLGRPAKATAA